MHALFPSAWIPQYSMVAFSRIPYHEVIKRAEKQDRILDAALGGILAAAVGLGAYFAYGKWGPRVSINLVWPSGGGGSGRR